MLFDFIINSLGSGGAEKQLLLIARCLASNGNEVRIFALEQREPTAVVKRRIEDCEDRGVAFYVPKESGVFFSLARTCAKVRYCSKARVVWAWGIRAELLAKFFIRKRPGDIFLSSLRSASADVISARKRGLQLSARKVDAYIANSEANLRLFEQVMETSTRTSSVLYNVVEHTSEKFDAAPDLLGKRLQRPFRIASLGNNRFHLKGYDLLLECADKALANGRDWHFSIAGRDYDGNLATEIDKRGLAGTVKYVGIADRANEFLVGHDMFILPSRVEGMPNALLEAMQLGMPCVSTKVGDLEHIFRDLDCLELVDVGSSDSLFRGISRLQADYAGAVEMGKRARQAVHAHFGQEQLYVRLVKVLFDVGCPTHAFVSGSCDKICE